MALPLLIPVAAGVTGFVGGFFTGGGLANLLKWGTALGFVGLAGYYVFFLKERKT